MTKAAQLMTDLDKEYEAVFRFGAETDTLDTEGTVTAKAPVPDFSDIEHAAKDFSGELTQVPPVYSAVKINGKRAYAQARKGQRVSVPERRVCVHRFELLSWDAPDLTVRIRCSKGTYIRSLARDLGLACGSRAYCLSLRRTGIGPFRVEKALAPEFCSPDSGCGPAEALSVLGTDIKSVSGELAARMRNGMPLGADFSAAVPVLYTDPAGNPAALVSSQNGRTTYRIVF